VKTNQTEWNAVLRRAVIRVKPEYFALPKTEREYYRLHMSTEDEFRIRQTVLKGLFGLAVNAIEELDSEQTPAHLLQSPIEQRLARDRLLVSLVTNADGRFLDQMATLQ